MLISVVKLGNRRLYMFVVGQTFIHSLVLKLGFALCSRFMLYMIFSLKTNRRVFLFLLNPSFGRVLSLY